MKSVGPNSLFFWFQNECRLPHSLSWATQELMLTALSPQQNTQSFEATLSPWTHPCSSQEKEKWHLLPCKRKKSHWIGENNTEEHSYFIIKRSILEKRVARTPVQMLQPLPYSHYPHHLMRADNQHGKVSLLVADVCLIGDCIHVALCKLTWYTPKGSFPFTAHIHFKLLCSIYVTQEGNKINWKQF